MPELPEVETIIRHLRTELIGKTIQDIHIFWNRSIQGDITTFKNNLIGGSFRSILRRGKYVCFRLDNALNMTIHLGMTGKLLLSLGDRERKHLRIEFLMKTGDSLYFHDTRKFGKVRLWPCRETVLPELGPEPMDADRVFRCLRSLRTHRAIKTVLLDQRVLAGIGNIYADEALFRAGIHPRKPFDRVSPDQIKRLGGIIPEILDQAIGNMGTTISDYRPPHRPHGENQRFLKVYGQQGENCQICGNKIEKIRINNRGTHFCPGCQME